MQARAAATRRLIVDAAVGLFDTVGFAGAPLADIIAATGVSKGSFYYHFENRESVAAAIITEADAKLQAITLEILSESSSKTLSNLIRSIFAVADLSQTDPLLRVGVELRGGLGQISSELDGFENHRQLFSRAISDAVVDGDVRADLDIEQAAFTLWSALLGAHQHCGATREPVQPRLADLLEILLPAICTKAAVDEYCGLVRELAGRSKSARA